MKTLKLIYLTLLVSCLSISCKKDKNATVISAHVDITLQNQNGQNLLAAPAVFSKANIDVYHMENGQPQLFNQPNLDADKGFLLIKDGAGIDKIRLFTDYTVNQPTSLTLIKFGNFQTDTIKCEYRFEEGSVFLEKVWHNGVLKARNFIITK